MQTHAAIQTLVAVCETPVRVGLGSASGFINAWLNAGINAHLQACIPENR